MGGKRNIALQIRSRSGCQRRHNVICNTLTKAYQSVRWHGMRGVMPRQSCAKSGDMRTGETIRWLMRPYASLDANIFHPNLAIKPRRRL